MIKYVILIIIIGLIIYIATREKGGEKAGKEGPKSAVQEVIEYGTGKTPIFAGQRAKARLIKTSIKQAVQYYEVQFGKKARSLEELVSEGALAKQYTRDEWNRELISRFSNGLLEVRSVGPDGRVGTADDWTASF